jgi:hypothetical protein
MTRFPGQRLGPRDRFNPCADRSKTFQDDDRARVGFNPDENPVKTTNAFLHTPTVSAVLEVRKHQSRTSMNWTKMVIENSQD